MRRSLAILLTGGLLLLGSMAVASGATAETTIAPTTTCSNSGIPDTPGLGLICEVTVVNTITASGGSAVVTVRECHGAANDAATCTTVTTPLTEPVTAVNQCNGVINGGGATLECSVQVTNNYVDIDPGTTAATVNQCVGSGDGIANTCVPFPATTISATVTQCNGSANGGTLVELTCTVTGTESSTNNVTINQCNGSANGGGALVICSANIANNAVAAPSPSPSTGPTAAPTAPPTDTLATTDVPGSGPTPVVFVGIFLLAFVVVASRWSLRKGRI